jgi:glycosyltransferase involved in cell wall biosynthesis
MINSISLVIATFNSANTLRRTLTSINNINSVIGIDIEVIVINNNSTDETTNLLDSYHCQFTFQSLFQTKQGQNPAKNTIFTTGRELGDLVIFTDDDVILPRDYLVKYAKLANQQPDYDMFGSMVDALWPEEPPEYIKNGVDIAVAFAVTPPENDYQSGEIKPVRLHGPSFAIRKSVFQANYRFNENIGPNGGNYMMGSETELLYRLHNDGYKAFFDTTNTVQHIIRAKQLTPIWLESRAYKAGRSLIMHQLRRGEVVNAKEVFGYPRWALFKRYKILVNKLFLSKRTSAYYRLLWESSHLKGYCDEYKNKSTSQNL